MPSGTRGLKYIYPYCVKTSSKNVRSCSNASPRAARAIGIRQIAMPGAGIPIRSRLPRRQSPETVERHRPFPFAHLSAATFRSSSAPMSLPSRRPRVSSMRSRGPSAPGQRDDSGPQSVMGSPAHKPSLA